MSTVIQDGAQTGFSEYKRDSAVEVKREALKTLPILDISPFMRESTLEERQAVAQKMRTACIDIGFFYITGHGIAREEMETVLDWGHKFFALPTEKKMTVHQSLNPGRQGYVSIGGVDPIYAQKHDPDIKERFSFSREPLPGEPVGGGFNTGESVWPSRDMLPGFEEFLRAHMIKRCNLARTMVRVLALSLDLPESYFDEMYRFMGGTLMFNYYPPSGSVAMKDTQWNFSPHTDYGVLTLLLQDHVGGLQARNAHDEWIDVPPLPGAFVVNIGDTLQMWTNDLYVSTLHRVTNPNPQRARLSQALFTYPHGDTIIQCLPSCHGPDNPPKHEPVRCKDYNQALVEQAARTGRPGLSKSTAARFKN